MGGTSYSVLFTSYSVPGRRGLSGDVCRTGPPGLIGLDGDLGSTVFRGSKVFDGSIGCQGSPGAIGTRGRQESEFPTRRICLPDRVVDEGKPGLCVVCTIIPYLFISQVEPLVTSV